MSYTYTIKKISEGKVCCDNSEDIFHIENEYFVMKISHQLKYDVWKMPVIIEYRMYEPDESFYNSLNFLLHCMYKFDNFNLLHNLDLLVRNIKEKKVISIDISKKLKDYCFKIVQ